MKDETITRFTGGPRTIYSFTDTFVVECPHCRHRAEVTKNSASGQYEFHCSTCHRGLAQRGLYKVSVNRYCPDCGYRVEVTLPAVKQKTSFVLLKCPACRLSNRFTPIYEDYVPPQVQDGETEPYFGSKLWLQDSFGAAILWAYTYEHLQHLKEYIQAKLRQRQTTTFSPMVERLPPFIKSAKNRKALLASIEKLTLKK
ncbi:YfgJ family double zinc ribbon protein [Hymenobacter metallicola]|uniref:Replication restart DNA helicase PriA n=1 Tax=Hymenobacter metallicola TaxID=2563114 RepID=A0A4Z0QE44_9BACT|nr:zinc-ribbon domain-containing protein [Hymenobacter metallicola]TGE28330.1 hypothetical protein E5K02_02370 [Hymenobacter metallicola]